MSEHPASSTPASSTPASPPPLPVWAPLVWFVVLAASLSFVVLTLVRPPGPLDDPDPAFQRDGLVLDGPVLPRELLGIELGGRPVVLLFLREPPDPQALTRWIEALPDQAEVRIILPEPTPTELPAPLVLDPLNAVADALGMPRPLDGGRPVGYAVVDPQRQLRYATLDPAYLGNAFEVTTIVEAVS